MEKVSGSRREPYVSILNDFTLMLTLFEYVDNEPDMELVFMQTWMLPLSFLLVTERIATAEVTIEMDIVSGVVK